MSDIDEGLLITAWHSTSPMYAVARAFNLKDEQVRLTWKRLQIENKLPPGRRSFVKPGSHKKQKLEPRPMKLIPIINGPEDHYDGRPSLLIHDPLLDQLRAVHHEPRYDIAPELQRKSP